MGQAEILAAAIKSRDAEFLKIEDTMNQERVELARMLAVFHKQLDDREAEIKQIMENIESTEKEERLSYWLHMYKQIMAQKPAELVHLEARVDPIVRDVLLTADCENYLSLFARHSIFSESDLRFLTFNRLKTMGIWSVGEQNRIMAAITKYVVPHQVEVQMESPTAPLG